MLSCPVGRWVNSVVEPLVRRGATSLLPLGPAVVAVETVGRRTQRVRTVPLLAFRVGNRVIVSTVRSRSDWFANLSAARRARVWLAGEARPTEVDTDDGPLLRTATLNVDDD
jgi:hypothetical protein